MFTNLVLSGGAIKGFHFIGVLQYLEHINIIHCLRSFVGSSAGSLICFLLCLGYTSDNIYKHCLTILHRYIEHNIDLDNFLNINDSLGIDDGSIIIGYLKQCLWETWKTTDISFIEFSKKSGLNLVVCASNISSRSPTFFCVENTPYTSVIDAIRASITLPFIFTPMEINGEIYVDAGIFNNFPIDYIENFVLKDTLGIRIRSKNYNPQKPLNLFSYTRILIDSMIDRINFKDDLLKKINLVDIDSRDEDVFDFNFDTMKIEFDMIKANLYVEKGYHAVKQILERKKEKEKENGQHEVHKKTEEINNLEYVLKIGEEQHAKRYEEYKEKSFNFSWVQKEPYLNYSSPKMNNYLNSIFE